MESSTRRVDSSDPLILSDSFRHPLPSAHAIAGSPEELRTQFIQLQNNLDELISEVVEQERTIKKIKELAKLTDLDMGSLTHRNCGLRVSLSTTLETRRALVTALADTPQRHTLEFIGRSAKSTINESEILRLQREVGMAKEQIRENEITLGTLRVKHPAIHEYASLRERFDLVASQITYLKERLKTEKPENP